MRRRRPGKAASPRETHTERSPAGSLGRRRVTPDDGLVPSTWFCALLGSALLWAALPPLAFGPLGWVAPIPWLLLVRRERLSGRRPYLILWASGTVFWLAMLHWLRYPHPATSIGWCALSGYLGVYLPMFVGLSRVATRRLRIPLALAAPMIWVGLELAEAHLLTGFGMASLGHTQYRWLAVIQIADLAGGYGVSFVVMAAAACMARALPCDDVRHTAWPLVPMTALALAVLGYGHWRTADATHATGPRVALIQGAIDTEVKADPDQNERIHRHYEELTRAALSKHSDVDLVVWPETMYRDPLLVHGPDARPPPDADWTLDDLRAAAASSRSAIESTAARFGTAVLLGVDTIDFGPGTETRYNSAVFVDGGGRLVDRYDKMHPVLFGEYIPFGEQWPWLYTLSPLGKGLTAGTRLPAFDVDGTRLAANVCYETVLPHVIRRQVDRMRREGREPHVLVNLTNDGWFRGSNELDLHLICGVFRAVECRKPLLVAANTGFSAIFDGDGRIVWQGRRRATDHLVADVPLDDRRSLYVLIGDRPAGVCLALCAVVGLFGLLGLARRDREREVSGEA